MEGAQCKQTLCSLHSASFSLLLGLAELFCLLNFLLYSYRSPFINYQKEFRDVLKCLKAFGSISDKFSLLIYRNSAKLFTEFDNLFYRILKTFLPNLSLANRIGSVEKTNLAERYQPEFGYIFENTPYNVKNFKHYDKKLLNIIFKTMQRSTNWQNLSYFRVKIDCLNILLQLSRAMASCF